MKSKELLTGKKWLTIARFKENSEECRNSKDKEITTVEENVGENVGTLHLAWFLVFDTERHKQQKKKEVNWASSKLKTSVNQPECQRQSIECVFFSNHIADKDFISGLY